MRRTALLVLPLALVTACSGSAAPEGGDDPVVSVPPAAPSASASSGPAAAAVPGERVLPTDPSHAHVEGPVDYPDAPPLGGEHNPRWLACDVYDEPVPDEFAVHSLEHGAVWLAHRPDVDAGPLAELAGSEEEYVLVSPYEGLDSPVVAVAWGRSLSADSADDPALARFVETYAGGAQGGEPGVPCRTGGTTPREARGLLGEQQG